MAKKWSKHYVAKSPYYRIPKGLTWSPQYCYLRDSSKHVYQLLVSKWSGIIGDDVQATYKEIGDATGYSYRTISRAYTQLVVMGFIQWKRRGGLPQNANAFVIDPEALEKAYSKQPKETLRQYESRTGNKRNYRKPPTKGGH